MTPEEKLEFEVAELRAENTRLKRENDGYKALQADIASHHHIVQREIQDLKDDIEEAYSLGYWDGQNGRDGRTPEALAERLAERKRDGA